MLSSRECDSHPSSSLIFLCSSPSLRRLKLCPVKSHHIYELSSILRAHENVYDVYRFYDSVSVAVHVSFCALAVHNTKFVPRKLRIRTQKKRNKCWRNQQVLNLKFSSFGALVCESIKNLCNFKFAVLFFCKPKVIRGIVDSTHCWESNTKSILVRF